MNQSMLSAANAQPSVPANLTLLPPIPTDIAQHAVEWWLQLQEAPGDAALQKSWQSWRAQSAQHEQAWQRMEAVQQRLQGLGDSPHAAWARTALLPQRKAGRRRVAQALLVVGGGVALQLESRTPWRSWMADVRTLRGERRRLTLADGTRLVLHGDSALDVAYSPTERRLVLRTGEVHVTSAPDAQRPARPLVVQTDAGEMRPLGTRFTVQAAQDARTLVAVYEGAVQLQPRLAPQQARVVAAGQQAWLEPLQVQAPTAANEESTAWIDGMLVARGMRLDAVLKALQPASAVTLVCHPDVASLQVSGTYPLDEAPRVMATLGTLLHLQVRPMRRWWGGEALAIGPLGVL